MTHSHLEELVLSLHIQHFGKMLTNSKEEKGRQESGAEITSYCLAAGGGEDFHVKFLLYFLNTHTDNSQVMCIKSDTRVSQILLIGFII